MPTSLADRLMPPLRRLAAARAPLPRSDGQLLTAFVQHLDPTAFEALVRRHGPMVLGICRRVITDRHAADDAFQAVFVVLARRAAAVKPREQVANFLFGVAYRTALKARGQLARRRSREKQVDAMPEPVAPAPPDTWADVQPVIDEELAALPDKLRLPVLLCDLEGRPQREVAKQLGLPPATLANRLASARRKLAGRLTARGVTLAGGALAAVLTANAASAVPVPLASAAAAVGLIAVGSGAGVVPANVLQLSEGVVRMMALSKLKLVTAAVLAGLTMLAGAGAGLVKAEDKPAAKAAKIRPDLDDKEYLKRVCDSLRGSPATPAEISYFVADQDTAKRKKVVTWLTDNPATTFDTWALTVRSLPEAREGFFVANTDIELGVVTKTPGDAVPPGKAAPNWARALGVRRVGAPDGDLAVWDFDADGRLDVFVTGEKVNPPVQDTIAEVLIDVGETDEAFLNRVFESARGGKPTRIEKEYFLADKAAKKREKLLDLILADPALKKKLGPDWKKNTLNPPQTYTLIGVFDAGNDWANKLIDELLAAKKTDDQTLEALTLAATGRLPTDPEKKLATAMVAKQKDKKAAWTEVATTLTGTDEAKKHADRLKPQHGGTLRVWTSPSKVQPTLPAEPKK